MIICVEACGFEDHSRLQQKLGLITRRADETGRGPLSYSGTVTAAAHDYSDLHQLIERLEPEQAEELREHALRLVRPAGGRFKILRSFNGPSTDLGARAREVMRAEFGSDDAGR